MAILLVKNSLKCSVNILFDYISALLKLYRFGFVITNNTEYYRNNNRIIIYRYLSLLSKNSSHYYTNK